MIYDFHPIWGVLKGKLSITPEEAKELFSFEMKPGAKGVFFRNRKGKHHICNLGTCKQPGTRCQVKNWEKFATIANISKLIRPIILADWAPPKYSDLNNYSLFFSVNLSCIRSSNDWDKLKLTRGSFAAPLIDSITTSPRTITILFHSTNTLTSIGIAIFNLNKYKKQRFYYLGEIPYKNSISISRKGPFPSEYILFIYSRSNHSYSTTVSFSISNSCKLVWGKAVNGLVGSGGSSSFPSPEGLGYCGGSSSFPPAKAGGY